MHLSSRAKAGSLIFGLWLLSLFIHLLPFLLYGRNPLGYDTGFYRRYLIQPFVSFPNTPVPGLGDNAVVPRLLMDTLRLIHIPTDILLYGSYIFCFTLLPVLLFMLLAPKLGKRGAFIAGVLIIFSAVSYNAYWYMLWKNIWALDLMLLAFLCIEQRRTAVALLVGGAIALSHETSAIIYLLTLGILFLLERVRRWEFSLHIAWVFILFLSVNFSIIHEVSQVLPSAIFLDWRTYFILSIPFFILVVFGVRLKHLQDIPKTFLVFGAASFLFPVFHLPFYERIFVFCDIAFAVVAAYGAEQLLRRINLASTARSLYLPFGILCIALGLVLGNLWNQVASLRPLVSDGNIQEIERIGNNLHGETYLLTTSNEAPWFEGWTNIHIIAPGLLHDTHNLEAWEEFWNATTTAAQTSFLDSFPKPLYVSTLGAFADLLGSIPPCLIETEAHLLYNACSANVLDGVED